jgi:predicted ArsR family transcriptional regulator
MSARDRFDRQYIEAELRKIAEQLQTDVAAYLIGGGAMSLHEPSLKDTTKDIDLVVVDEEALTRLLGVLDALGYEEVTDLGDEYDRLGARHCVRNDAGCQFDVFYRQVADKLFFSDGMQARSDPFLATENFTVSLVSFEDIFLFKAVAERPDDIGDMATLVQTNLDFEVIEEELERQVELLGGEFFVTVISESLERLNDTEGIQTPLDAVVRESYQRYMKGYELRMQLTEDTPRCVSDLAAELGVSADEIERRVAYLEQYGFATRTSEGIQDTGKHSEFTRS